MKRRYYSRRFSKTHRKGKKRKAIYDSSSDFEDEEDYVPSSDPDLSISDLDSESDSEKRLIRLAGRRRERLSMAGDEGPEKLDSGSDIDDQREYKAPVDLKKKRKPQKKKDDKPTLLWEAQEEEIQDWIDAWIDINGTASIDSEISEGVMIEAEQTPRDITMPLLKFQKEWLAWALKQEASEFSGGILADEMGMGKTIQAISLVLAARDASCSTSAGIDLNVPTSSLALPKCRGTLVICPLVAVTQWKNEIARFTNPGSVKVLVHHGPKRSVSARDLFDYDFVLTTYSTVEAEYRKYIMPPKERCEWCGKLLSSEKMAVHLKYFCGPTASRSEKQSKQVRKEKRTKVVSSGKKSLVVEDESDDLERRSKKRGRPVKKAKSCPSNHELGTADKGSSSTGRSVLHSVEWARIILDEAHNIKDRRSNTARAVLSLESTYKWALSGTPLQNRVGELYSLIRFLRIYPYSYYFCKDCDCKCLDYSSTVDCPSCAHAASRHFCWWNRNIARPIQAVAYQAEGRRAMILLRYKLLKSILLRRTKESRSADLALPPRTVFVRRDTLDSREEDYYDALYTQSQAQFDTYVAANTLMNNYAHIFDLLTRLRQALDHPYLVVYSAAASLPDGNRSDDVDNCGICHEPAEDAVDTACEHVFCKSCLLDYSTAVGNASCPTCSKPMTVDLTTKKSDGDQIGTVKGFKRSSILNRINLDDFQTSTKIEALREEIRCMIERDGSAKGIIFSQYTSFLDLIKYSLQKSGLQCVQLVGSMSMAARDDAIRRFTDDPDCKVFLMSLKAGGVALNLTVASHVFLMDPWWNPAVERQAQDRIHRIGQYKPIRIVRFIIENTIEERILKLQEKKELVFEGTVGNSMEALGKLTLEDLKFLFNN